MFGRLFFQCLALPYLCCISAGFVCADEPKKKEGKEQPKSIEVKVEADFRSVVEFDAVVESGSMHPVSVAAEEWSDFEVVEVVAHGSKVKEGDVLVRFDDHKISLAILELEHSLASGNIALAQSVEELKNLEKLTPISLALAEKARDEAKEACLYFLNTEREHQIESAKFSVLAGENSLRNVQEELNQLKKMYEADDLTEETEEIILKRARFSVQSAERSLIRTKLNSERNLKTLIPRAHEALKTAAEKAELEFSLAKEALPSALKLKELAVTKAKRDREQSVAKLARLKADVNQIVLKAPASGHVFYGSYQAGKWATAAAAKVLVRGGKASPQQVLVTVVGSDDLRLYATVPENQVGLLSVGMNGVGVPKADAASSLSVEVTEAGEVPLTTGMFSVQLAISGEAPATLAPGKSVKISVTAFEAKNAVAIPASVVQRDRSGTYVDILLDDEKVKSPVVIEYIDGKTAIVKSSNLKDGTKIWQK